MISPQVVGNTDRLKPGKVLAVDPGKDTGYALIDVVRELVCYYGEVKMNGAGTIDVLAKLMSEAGLLVIENQYLEKNRKKQNPQSLIKLAALRGGIEMLWAREKGLSLGVNVVLVNPKSWKTCLKLPTTAGRDREKAAAQKQAKILTGIEDIPENASDAICMGLREVREMKKAQRGLI